jgi:type IV pilus assembly protein PilB
MARLTRMTRKRLGDVLVEQGMVDEAAVKEALKEQRSTGELLGEVLVRMGYVTEMNIAGAIVTQFALPYIQLSQYRISPEILKVFPPQTMRQYRFMPLDRMGDVMSIAVGGLLNEDVLSELEKVVGCKILVYITVQSEVIQAIQKAFPETPEEAAAAAAAAKAGPAENDESALAEAAMAQMAGEAPAAAPAGAADSAHPAEPAPPVVPEDLSSLGSLLLGDEVVKKG